MSGDEVQMFPIMCDGECGRRLGWTDTKRPTDVLLCNRCMDHPEDVESRLGVTS